MTTASRTRTASGWSSSTPPGAVHCKNLAPEYQKAAKALKGIIGVGAVDCDQHKQLCGQYGVQGFPTIKVFGSNKNKPEDYQGARDANGIVQAAQNAAQKIVRERMGGKSSGSSGGGSKGGKDAVIELTESNFKKLVLDSDDMWLVEFFAPWLVIHAISVLSYSSLRN